MTASDYARRMGNTLIADWIDAWTQRHTTS